MRTRKIEIDVVAFPGGLGGPECSASVAASCPPQTTDETANALALAMAGVLAALWGIDPNDVQGTVCLVDTERSVVSYHDVERPGPAPVAKRGKKALT